MMTFCTLFNSGYLDKGLALIDSLEKNASSYKLYVLAMDDRCYEVLKDQELSNVNIVSLKEFENDDLLRVKSSRKLGEYYWTCSSWLISFILDQYKPDYCTYIDADLYIYSEPSVIIDEMERRNASVQIVSHRFMDFINEHACKGVGKYCVEFNTFKNDKNGRRLLDIWKKQVLDECTVDASRGLYGDQKYLDNWIQDYPFVIDTENVGAGVGPWNLCQYRWKKKDTSNQFVVSRWGKKAPLLFVHFEDIKYIDDNTANISLVHSWKTDKLFIDAIYKPYLKKVGEIKNMLKDKYGIYNLIKSHPAYQSSGERRNFFRRLYNMIFVDKRFFHSLMTNILISLPNKIFKQYSIIRF